MLIDGKFRMKSTPEPPCALLYLSASKICRSILFITIGRFPLIKISFKELPNANFIVPRSIDLFELETMIFLIIFFS